MKESVQITKISDDTWIDHFKQLYKTTKSKGKGEYAPNDRRNRILNRGSDIGTKEQKVTRRI